MAEKPRICLLTVNCADDDRLKIGKTARQFDICCKI